MTSDDEYVITTATSPVNASSSPVVSAAIDEDFDEML
jgi:hypothetical protein